jgi:hypothetical protein
VDLPCGAAAWPRERRQVLRFRLDWQNISLLGGQNKARANT